MPSLRIRAVAIILLAASVPFAGNAIAQKRRQLPQYKIEDLGGNLSAPFRINDVGVIVAHVGPDAVRVTSSRVEVLWPGRAHDINAAGEVVGATNGQAVKSSLGAVVALGFGGARAINDIGQVVGYASLSAALWEVDQTEVLLPNLGTEDIVANGINNAGVIVGQGRTPERGPYYAVVWRDDVIRILDSLPGDNGPCMTPNGPCGSRAHRVNSTGQIVGSSDVPGGGFRAVIWADGPPLDLGTLGDHSTSGSEGVDINDAGWVVGDSDSRAFLFDGVEMLDLNTLIRGRNPFTRLAAAQSINNRGDIVGVGWLNAEVHAFLARRVR